MKSKIFSTLLVLMLVFSVMCQTLLVQAHSGDVLSAEAIVTPTINGVIGAEEWDDADSVTFTLSYSGESHECTLYVKNDALNLYLAVVVIGDDYCESPPYYDSLWFTFDNDHDGCIFLDSEVGDDKLYMRADGVAGDMYWDGGNLEIWSSDTSLIDGGTNDIVGAASHTDTSGVGDYTFELSHPLDTADDAHDFSLSAGDTVGFKLTFADWDLGTSILYQSSWPNLIYADIIIAPLVYPPPSISPTAAEISTYPGIGSTILTTVYTGEFSFCNLELILEEGPPYSGWVTIIPEYFHNVDTGSTLIFEVVVTPYEWTNPGDYTLNIKVQVNKAVLDEHQVSWPPPVVREDFGIQTITVHVLPAVSKEYVDELIDEFEGEIEAAYAAGDIPRGTRNSFLAKLGAVVTSKEKESYGAAANKMNAFLNELDAQYGAGRVSNVEPYYYYDTWRGKAENIKTLLEELAGQ